MKGMIRLKVSKAKGFTMIELLVVIFIIFMLFGIGMNAYGKYYENAKINAVKQELASWMSDFNQYVEDFGKPAFSASAKNIKSKQEYLAYVYKGTFDADISDINTENASDFERGSFLGLLQNYIAETLCIQKPEDAVFESENNHHIVLTTKVKKDPWGNPYYFYIDTVSGVVIVLSSGIDGVHDITQYSLGIYGDDLVLVVDPK